MKRKALGCLLLFLLWALPMFAAQPPVPARTSSVSMPASGQQPFGAELFQGFFAKSYFDELNADYQIIPGDRVRVQLWGARSFDGVLEVDARGNVFLPEIGPLRVEGMRHAELEGLVKEKVRSVYTSNVEVYTNLLNPQPVAVFVTGFVSHPGRYAGGPTDSVLYFIDQAGGIDAQRGSYRDIRILKNGKQLAQIDLYPFVLAGKLEKPRLETGDVILVGERGDRVLTEGQVRYPAAFEFPKRSQPSGKDLCGLAFPLSNVSHVSIVGYRDGSPYNVYLPLDDFQNLSLQEGDTVRFHADIPGDTIMVAARGAIVGASRYPVQKSTRLKELLHYIEVEPELANLEGIHLRRKSVAIQQKKVLDEALKRLEQSSLTATSASVDEASIRVREAELIAQFVERARQIQPDGTVMVGRNGKVADIYLENGDEIIIPLKSDVVLVGGEVMMPQAVVWDDELKLKDYIVGAGGFSDRADKKRLLVVKPNGEVLSAKDSRVMAGDQILVLPRFDSKNMQVIKDVSQILYQIAVAAKVALDL